MGLGKQVGSTRINRYERQERFPALDDLDLLADTLQVPAAALLAEDDATVRAICALHALSAEDRVREAARLERACRRKTTE